MISLPAGSRIWLVPGITDMRNGFNGLASKVQNVLKDDPFCVNTDRIVTHPAKVKQTHPCQRLARNVGDCRLLQLTTF